MSRIGRAPITLPKGVSVEILGGNVVKVKGPKGELFQAVDQDIAVKVDDGVLSVERPTEQKKTQSLARNLPRCVKQHGKGSFRRIRENP